MIKTDRSISSCSGLSRALAAVLGATATRPVTVLNRKPLGQGTFRGEIVECRVGRGRVLTVFCKYGKAEENYGHGHRGGPEYEAAVYQHVLRHSRCSLPMFRGSYEDPDTGGTWLVIGFLPDSFRINKAPDCQQSMRRAAAWIGRFHAEQEPIVRNHLPRFLKRYDSEYYLGWARRTRRLSRPLRERFPWLAQLFRRIEPVIEELANVERVIVHGEYYPANILLHNGSIYPVDWESAAIGAGEIDLVTLTENWGRAITQECEAEYARHRWSKGMPGDFQRRLALARLYVHLRWLGDLPEWTLKSGAANYKQLHKTARQLGMFSEAMS